MASTTLTEPLDWQNSTLIDGDVAAAVAALKQEDDGDLHVIGSTGLVRTLIEQDLVDEFRLMIDPILLGVAASASFDDGSLRAAAAHRRSGHRARVRSWRRTHGPPEGGVLSPS